MCVKLLTELRVHLQFRPPGTGLLIKGAARLDSGGISRQPRTFSGAVGLCDKRDITHKGSCSSVNRIHNNSWVGAAPSRRDWHCPRCTRPPARCPSIQKWTDMQMAADGDNPLYRSLYCRSINNKSPQASDDGASSTDEEEVKLGPCRRRLSRRTYRCNAASRSLHPV